MKANVYIKDDIVHLIYDDDNYDKINKTVYQLGSSILDFAHTDLNEKNEIYNKFIEYAFCLYEFHYEQNPKDRGRAALAEIRMDDYCPYSYFHLKSFLDAVYTAIADQRTDLTPALNEFPELKNYQCSESDPVRKYVYTVKEILLTHLKRRAESLKKEIDFIVNLSSAADEHTAKLTPMQRLYILDLKRENKEEAYYTKNPFKTQFVPLLNGVPVSENISIRDISEKNLEVVEMYEINHIDDLIRFELLKMVSNGVPVKKCANCGQYFVPAGRIDTVYCNRVYKKENPQKTCAEIGSMLKYKEKIKDDPIYTAYNKAYKRNNSRVRNKTMTQNDFLKWSEEARRRRDDCYSGTLSLKDYMIWLE
jgi:hypothetical protein